MVPAKCLLLEVSLYTDVLAESYYMSSSYDVIGSYIQLCHKNRHEKTGLYEDL